MNVTFRAIRPSEYDQCFTLWQTCFAHITADAFARFVQTPQALCYLLGGFAAGRLVSTTQIIPQCLQEPAAPLWSGYITNVCSHPDFRRQGLATGCLQQALEIMHTDGLQITRLIATEPALYTKLGWVASPLPLLQGTIPTHLPALSPLYRVRPAQATELPQIAALYARYNQERPLAVSRPLAYWQHWMCAADGSYLYPTMVCLSGTHLVGYIQVCRHPVWEYLVTEIAARDNDPQVLSALLASGVRWVQRSAPAALLRLAVPVEEPILKAIQTVLTNVECWATLPWMYRELQGSGVNGNFARSLYKGYAAHTWWFDGF